MQRYIKLDDAIATLHKYFPLSFDRQDAEDDLKSIPPAEVEEVRHGEWIWSGMGKESPPYCSECKRETKWCEDYGFIVEDYCPFCGAKMDGKNNEDE